MFNYYFLALGNGIDVDSVLLLDEESIKKLCPALGDQLKINHQLKLLKERSKCPGQDKEVCVNMDWDD